MGNSDYAQHVARIERHYEKFLTDKFMNKHVFLWEMETYNRYHPFYKDRYHHIIWNRFHFEYTMSPPYDKLKSKNYNRKWGRNTVCHWIKNQVYPKD